MVLRGLLLLGMMLVIVAMVCVVVFRAQNDLPKKDSANAEMAALAIPNPSSSFPGQVNWGALAALSESLPSSSGWQVRYNAAGALARRGSAQLPFDVISQMLDEQQQMRNFRVQLPDGMFTVDEYAASSTVVYALKAMAEWHKHKEALKAMGADNAQLQRVYAAIDKLTRSQNQVVRQEAERVQKLVRN